MPIETGSASTVDTSIDERSGHSWEEATITLGMCEKLDLESLSKKKGCAVRLIKNENGTMEYEITMGPTPTCPAGTRASIAIEIDDEVDSILKVVATNFISRHALLDFLHYVLNLDLEELLIVGIYFQGSMGDVLHQGDEGLFARLWS